MYYVTDYYTNKVITCVLTFEIAKLICDTCEGSQVKTEEDEVLYTNIQLPF